MTRMEGIRWGKKYMCWVMEAVLHQHQLDEKINSTLKKSAQAPKPEQIFSLVKCDTPQEPEFYRPQMCYNQYSKRGEGYVRELCENSWETNA
jgi:hypothetical protein